jgi:hypothetical protein
MSQGGWIARRSAPFSGGSIMTRQLFFAIALIGTGVLLFSPAEAATAFRCEDQAANCVGRCANPGGGTNDNKCMSRCDKRVIKCLVRAHNAYPRLW